VCSVSFFAARASRVDLDLVVLVDRVHVVDDLRRAGGVAAARVRGRRRTFVSCAIFFAMRCLHSSPPSGGPPLDARRDMGVEALPSHRFRGSPVWQTTLFFSGFTT